MKPRVRSVLTAVVVATLLVPARAQAPPSVDRIAELSAQWVDPVTDAPPGTTYHICESASCSHVDAAQTPST